MSTTHRPNYPLGRPGVLIAALPAVLGFVPENSLVLVTAAEGDMGAVLRADLSGDEGDSLRHLAELAAASRAEAAVAVIVDDEGAPCQMCAEEYRALEQRLDAELAGRGVDLLAALVVDRVAAGGRWYCADGCGSSGVVDDPAASPMAAAAVLDGRRLYARRSELVAVVAPVDPERSAALVREIEQVGAVDLNRPDSQARNDIEHALACAEQMGGGRPLADGQLVRLALALTDPRVRDTLYALAVGERAGSAESLWADLARRLPDPWRVEALVLLAFSAYARGDGPLAGVSLDAARRSMPMHRMAGMLDTALQSGMRPEQIRELAGTGYRLAEQLGIRLPPSKRFGRRAG